MASDRAIKLARITGVVGITVSGLWAVNVMTPLASADDDSKCPVTAATTLGWGTPNRSDSFSDASSLDGWSLYDGPGHNNNGIRTPDAMSVADGQLTITADAQGRSGGMAWYPGQLHGRWEVCVRSLPSAETYHSVVLLWPDAEDWPVGGEIDFMEILDPTRQLVEGFLHYGHDNQQVHGAVAIDATQWHAFAVEWTPDRIEYYVDGRPWWQTTDVAILPPRPMHLAIQLDNFGGDTSRGGQTDVDWARQYFL